MIRLWIISLLCVAAIGVQAAAPTDPWCGTDGGELPDLWQQTMLEVEALEAVSAAEAWSCAPGRVGVFLNKLALLQRGSVRQGPDLMTHLRKTMSYLGGMRSQLTDAALATNVTAFTQGVSDVRKWMDDLHARYATGSLKPGVAAFNPALVLPSAPTLSVKALAPSLTSNQAVQVDLRLRDGTGQGVGSLQLMEMHTRRLHALIIDPALEDYHHEHPITSGRPGDFVFVFTPRKSGSYLMWLDVTPLATGRNETPETVIGGNLALMPEISRVPSLESTNDGWRFELLLDRRKVVVGQPVNARLRVTDPQGKACFALEPLMGSFAHVVGFLDDRHTMIHVHAHGETPHELSRSGPVVPFRFIAPKSGFLKFFIQTQVGGSVLLAKFGFPVEQAQ